MTKNLCTIYVQGLKGPENGFILVFLGSYKQRVTGSSPVVPTKTENGAF